MVPMTGSKVLVSIRVRATPERAFEAFTREIGMWWRANPLFNFTPRTPGVLSFEPGPDGRLIETREGGKVFEIGRVRAWAPPHRLVFGWRQAAFAPGEDTEVQVRFEPVGEETRVTVEHFGWDSVPQDHVARHHFPNALFLTRHGEWWRSLLGSYKNVLGGDGR
jgi:uncharacterized protein YndB with AHSA1/START domain